MYENKDDALRAVLVSVNTGEFDAEQSLCELSELAATAGAVTVATATQNRDAYDKATCVGAGRLEEIKQTCDNENADLIIFDHELTATQLRNIEDIAGVRVIDRTMLILDIFAMRANTKEGRVQVELAQQRYRLPRLAGIGTQMSRLGGGIGTRGPGETKLETDKRHIRSRIKHLEAELSELEARRNMLRSRRKKDNVQTVAIVGYTNAGKSTLLNALTGAGVLAENKLFATLDPTARALLLPDGRSVLLIDTVGLIRRLPHHLIEAFKSTLEEAAQADLILHVCDASSEQARQQAQVTLSLLSELGCAETPVITVFNKCDMLESIPKDSGGENNVFISAATGYGLDRLLIKISRTLEARSRRMSLLLPYDKAGLTAKIRKEGKVFKEEYRADGIFVDALVDRTLYSDVEAFIDKS